MKTRFAAILLLAALTLLPACKKQPEPVTTAPPITLPAVVKPEATTAATETAAPEEPTAPFEFDEDEAEYLGYMNSPIYGRLYLYQQDGFIVIYDSYSTRLFLVDGQGFTRENAEDLLEEDPDSTTQILNIGDLDFDGDLDFRLLLNKDSLNEYFACWLWDMEKKTFEPFRPLSVIPNPDFDAALKKVVSYNRINSQNAIVTEYEWQGKELLPTGFREVNNGSETYLGGPEDVDAPLGIFDGMAISGVTIQGNANSDSKWLCKIENEAILYLFSTEYNEFNRNYRFTFAGIQPGTTTVVLRYATSWEADYIAERVLNVVVNPDMTLRIIDTR